MIKITGYYQLPGDLPQPVDFADLFNTSFMRHYTQYRSFDRFLRGGSFEIASQTDFEALPESAMDAHVRRHTRFSSWKDMIDTATDLYVHQKLSKS